MTYATQESIGAALGRIPQGLFLLTAAHEDRRMGMLASWVQQVCFQPPMVCIAVAKGRSIMPLLSESRHFALCQIAAEDRIIQRKFSQEYEPTDDPFLGFEMIHATTPGLPILKASSAFLECELACHLDVEGDHDLFVGKVLAGHATQITPHVHFRENGFDYA
ncbi:flavin reductase family protein [Mucisphaera sp.]|uniref:flavin reductase family protein n=1 Tax=Mucisphaera sp. TaxID=2913024 RepID=UPI003D0EB99F